MSPPDSGISPSSETTVVEPHPPPHSTRRPRKQVSRACDLCRARRIRCDNGEPCKACRIRGADCTHRGDDEPRTLPAALREVDRLRRQIQELESQVQTLKLRPAVLDSNLTPPDSSTAPSPAQQQMRSSVSFPSYSQNCPKPQWKGVQLAMAGSDQLSYFGPASSYYLISRMGGFLRRMLQQPCPDESLQPHGARISMMESCMDAGIMSADAINVTRGRRIASKAKTPVSGVPETSSTTSALTRVQEESVMRLFWEGYHALMPVLDETEFRRHYNSLWEPAGRTTRKNCALVDIIIALCLQWGYAFIPKQISTQASNVGDSTLDDATLAGRWYYLRSQSLLTASLENPSIQTVQCYIFMVSYLCCASFHNMSHILEAQAVRTAEVLGLHLEPSHDLPQGEREQRRRIWWVLWALDAKTSAKFGRPLVVDWAQVSVAMPSDDIETASYNGATLGSYGTDVTWLTFARQNQLMFLVVTDINDTLFFRCGEMIQSKGVKCFYHDPDILETCAQFLGSKLPAMREWLDNVPEGFKIRRRVGGRPFSLDRSALDIDPLAPTWLQRQAVCLELTYHNLMANMLRIFITFYTYPGTYTPTAERHATMAVEHAIAFTLIMHQVITETDLLSVWSEYFSVQWNVSLTIVAFILAYPIHSATPRARETLDKAIAVFNYFGTLFAVSADAASIIKDLVAKADFLISTGSLTRATSPYQSYLPSATAAAASSTSSVAMVAEQPSSSSDNNSNTVSAIDVPEDLSWLDPNQNDPSQFDQFMDWAFSVDSFNNFERFFDTNNPADPRAFEHL